MSTLFTVNKPWSNRTALFEQLAFAGEGDAILLIEDSVLALQSPIALASFIAKCEAFNIGVFALADDVKLRGVHSQYDSIALVDFAGFVDLVSKHDKQVAW